MGHIIGIDYGTKRIGLAVGDTAGTLAAPLKTIPSSGQADDDVRQILASVSGFDVDSFVVGLPLNMDGSSGEQAALTRRFGKALSQKCGCSVIYFDERLSSFAADELLSGMGLSKKKRKRRQDSIAAQQILQRYLEALASEDGPA